MTHVELNKLAEFCHKHRLASLNVDGDKISMTFEPGAHVSIDDVIGKDLKLAERPKPRAYSDEELFEASG